MDLIKKLIAFVLKLFGKKPPVLSAADKAAIQAASLKGLGEITKGAENIHVHGTGASAKVVRRGEGADLIDEDGEQLWISRIDERVRRGASPGGEALLFALVRAIEPVYGPEQLEQAAPRRLFVLFVGRIARHVAGAQRSLAEVVADGRELADREEQADKARMAERLEQLRRQRQQAAAKATLPARSAQFFLTAAE